MVSWGFPELTDSVFIGVVDSTRFNTIFFIDIASASNLGRLGARNTSFFGVSGTTDILDAWHHLVGRFISDTEKRLYVDGIEEGNLTVSVTFATTVDRISHGVTGDSSPGEFFDGQLAHGVLWNANLSVNEISALARGVNPFPIRHSDQVVNLPIDGNVSPEPDYSPKNRDGTVTGTTKATKNPPVQLLSRYMSGH